MMGRPSILVIDDEPQIQRFLRHSLEAAGYSVNLADRAATAFRSIEAQKPDLVILDLGLPDLDGKAVLGQLRQTLDIPVLVLSARDDESEKIAALDLGANDYVAKPFGIGELLARIRACLRPRHLAGTASDVLKLGDLVIDISAHRVERRGEVIRLTPKEFELLALLSGHVGRVLTHRHILTKIWGPAHVEDVAYLRVFIGQLRQKIEADPAEPKLITTEPGVGYRANDTVAPFQSR
jgi:two-component system, OmpR family, KDP operon response regulator KdpE